MTRMHFVITLALLLGAVMVSRLTSMERTLKKRDPYLPPLMRFYDGRPVRIREDFARRRTEIKRLLIRHFVGTFPKCVPTLLKAENLETRVAADGSTRRRLCLTFNTVNRASFEIRVWVPKARGPYPVLLVAPRAYQFPWAEDALKDGYLVCLYPGVEQMAPDDEFGSYIRVRDSFRKEYPRTTWTELSGKTWLASRALDYVLGRDADPNVAAGQVGIIGHSRYGKQSLMAAAFDERITAVVARSPGSPGSCLIVAPRRDWYADHGDVSQCVSVARAAWKKEKQLRALTFEAPDDIARLQRAQQDRALKWLATACKP